MISIEDEPIEETLDRPSPRLYASRWDPDVEPDERESPESPDPEPESTLGETYHYSETNHVSE